MKIKRNITIAGLLTIAMMAASMASIVAQKPVLAASDALKWTRIDTPGAVPGKNDIVSPCEVNRIIIGSDGKTFYAVDIANPDNTTGSKALYKSTDSGISWSDTTSRNLFEAMSPAEQNNFRVWNVSIAPDDTKFVAAITNDSITTLPRNVWTSTDGGNTWQNTNLPTIDNISAIDISPNYGKRDIFIGTRNGSGNGTVWMLKAPDFSNWVAQGVIADIMSIKSSPSYRSDNIVVIVYSDINGTYLNAGIHDLNANTTDWTTIYGGSPPEVTTGASGSSPKANEIITANLELPSDFSGQTPSLRRIYVSTDASKNNTGIFRIDDTTVYQLMDTTDLFATKRISSIAYYGTYASGKLLAGEVLGNPYSATVMTWFTDAPTTCPIPCWYNAMKPPTGAAGTENCAGSGYGNAQVAWSPDGAIAFAGTASSEALVDVSNWPTPYLIGKDLDESAFSISRNNGETWNQLALIDTKIDRFVDIAPSPDCSTVYLASVNKNANCSGFDSVWRSQSSHIGSVWERVLCQPTTDQDCTTGQTDIAILGLAGDKADGQIVFWAAVGTRKIMWSPDFGDYWTNISQRFPVQDMAAEDSKTLYVLSPDGYVQKFTFSGTGWVSGSSVSTELDTGYSIATAYTGLTPDNDKGHIIVGGTGTGIYDVAYSTDGGASFTPITTQLPTRGNTMVIAHSGYKSNGEVFAINSGGMYEWSTYYGGGAWAWPLPEKDSWSIQWGGPSWPTPVTSLAISRNGGFYFCDAWAAYIRWSWASAGLDPTISFGTEPTRRLRICGGLESGEPITVWLIDQRQYNPPQGGVWRYRDTLSWIGPTPVAPVSQAMINLDPVSGRASEINLIWKPVSLAKGYTIEIAKDEDFSLKVAYIGGYCKTSNLVRPQETICTGWSVPFYVPHDLDAPALVIPPGGGKVIDANGNSWTVPTLEAGHTYYWRVTIQSVSTGDNIYSPSSWREMFIVKEGLQTITPYYGPQLLSPNNGYLGCPVKSALFTWLPFTDTTRYKFVLAKDAAMTEIVVETELSGTCYKHEGALDYSTSYFWQVMALEPTRSDWSATFAFRTEDAPLPLPTTSQQAPLWGWIIVAIGVILDISLLILIFQRRFD
jgi:hypothetical protein